MNTSLDPLAVVLCKSPHWSHVTPSIFNPCCPSLSQSASLCSIRFILNLYKLPWLLQGQGRDELKLKKVPLHRQHILQDVRHWGTVISSQADSPPNTYCNVRVIRVIIAPLLSTSTRVSRARVGFQSLIHHHVFDSRSRLVLAMKKVLLRLSLNTTVPATLTKKLNILWSFIKMHLQFKVLIFLSSGKQVRFVYESFRRMQP